MAATRRNPSRSVLTVLLDVDSRAILSKAAKRRGWKALKEPIGLTTAQRKLGKLMRGKK
jgi:hypothetical protein